MLPAGSKRRRAGWARHTEPAAHHRSHRSSPACRARRSRWSGRRETRKDDARPQCRRWLAIPRHRSAAPRAVEDHPPSKALSVRLGLPEATRLRGRSPDRRRARGHTKRVLPRGAPWRHERARSPSGPVRGVVTPASAQLAIEPGPGQRPIALHGNWRDFEHFRGLFNREAAEESQLDEPALSRIERRLVCRGRCRARADRAAAPGSRDRNRSAAR